MPDSKVRLHGLAPRHAVMLRRVAQLEAAGDHMMSGVLLLELSALATPHAEVLRWQGLRSLALDEPAAAATFLCQATGLRPQDSRLHLEHAIALDRALRVDLAHAALAAAAQCAQSAAEWLAVSLESDRQGLYPQALSAVERALQLKPEDGDALLQATRCHKALGNTDAAAASCRRLIASGQHQAKAWFSLVDLKTVPLTALERRCLEALSQLPALSHDDRILTNFALGKAHEDAGDYGAAATCFGRANTAVRQAEPWDARAFDAHAADVRTLFAEVRFSAIPAAQGAEVVFLVGLPRSGTTLVEQVLASHSKVEGASELPFLQQVIDDESRRRGQSFPNWVPSADSADWCRLGREYLARSARWRYRRPMSTDKMPGNWLLAGAIRAMLPQARIVNCRRDPLETCWSCYKQRFAPRLVGFSHDFDDLAAYWRTCAELSADWAAQDPAQWRTQSYEALVQQPEAEIRALLDFCGLDFEPGCLQFHRAQRAIRTPSALQVRQPLVKASTPAAGYGELLAPLRDRLVAVGAYGGDSS